MGCYAVLIGPQAVHGPQVENHLVKVLALGLGCQTALTMVCYGG